MTAHMDNTEKLIARRCIDDLLAAGFTISVNDGEETTLHRCTDPLAILDAMATTEEDYLYLHQDGARSEVRDPPGVFSAGSAPTGWVRFIYGNDCDVINDYTTNLETVMAGTNALVDRLAGGEG
jgi:hypothetical protein